MNWIHFAIGSAFFAGLTAILGKIGVNGIDSNLATLIRTVFVLILTALVVFSTNAWQNPAALPGRSILFLLLSAVATGASWLCYYRALQLGPASKVAPIDKLSVVFAIILAILFLKEQLELKAVVGAILIVLGAIFIAL
jgi:transporter family protein